MAALYTVDDDDSFRFVIIIVYVKFVVSPVANPGTPTARKKQLKFSHVTSTFDAQQPGESCMSTSFFTFNTR